VLLRLRRPAEALEAVTEALRLDPRDEQAHYLRGVALSELPGGEAAAVAAFERAASLDPAVIEPHIALGYLATRAGDPARAQAHLVQAMALDPGNEWALANLAGLRQHTGDDAAAVDWLLRSAAVHPTGPGGRGLAEVAAVLRFRLAAGLTLTVALVGLAIALADGLWPAFALAAGLLLTAALAWRPLRRMARIPARVRAELLWRRPPARAGLLLAALGVAALVAAIAQPALVVLWWSSALAAALASLATSVLRPRSVA
jgi:tetratricopeptide (TPR) repeat protein